MKADNDSTDEQPKYFNSQTLTAHIDNGNAFHIAVAGISVRFFFSASSFYMDFVRCHYRTSFPFLALSCLSFSSLLLHRAHLSPFASEYFVSTFGRFFFFASISVRRLSLPLTKFVCVRHAKGSLEFGNSSVHVIKYTLSIYKI